jgi:hypothetical protein
MNEELTADERAIVIRNLKTNVESQHQPEPDEPMVNAYICQQCGHVAFTVDTAEGTTPMSIPCTHAPTQEEGNIVGMDNQPLQKQERCAGHMVSSWYCVKRGDYCMEEVEFEWRSPSINLFHKLRKQRSPLLGHVLDGGLMLCKRDANSPVRLHSGEFMKPCGKVLTDDELAGHRSEVERLRAGMALYKAAQAARDRDKENRVKRNRDKARAARKAKKKHAKRNRRR